MDGLRGGLDQCTGSLHFGKRPRAQASKMPHHHDQTLPEAKAARIQVFSPEGDNFAKQTNSPRSGNKNYDLGLDKSDLIVVNILSSNRNSC